MSCLTLVSMNPPKKSCSNSFHSFSSLRFSPLFNRSIFLSTSQTCAYIQSYTLTLFIKNMAISISKYLFFISSIFQFIFQNKLELSKNISKSFFHLSNSLASLSRSNCLPFSSSTTFVKFA
jgi:hypothetical protein